ncbi:hypothetical protein ACFFQW_40450 [Umezawaea endophytica]|uniref:Lipoprotein n=1 Tax=Umezawaea endophytica TaxID=1654476 RepID=A0A9X2VY68_9PSEU|nr:hypothetical protein [Umezawaea endophytica]MCS7484164.1 hypothetical protein [Umezawaea endophytica]
MIERPVLAALPVLVVALFSVGTGCGQSPPRDCLPPSADTVRADAARSLFVARVVVTGHPELVKGPTSGDGLMVRAEATLAGEPPPAEFAVWPAVSTPELPVGKTVIVFAGPSRALSLNATTADGVAVTDYQIAVPNGVLDQHDGVVARLCKEFTSSTVPDDVLDGL